MSISIELIKNLRDQSGVSITACKKALEEANGDIDAAFDLLRKKGEAKAKERSERATTEGVVAITSSADKTSYVVIGCETDFVSKNEDFVSAVNEFSSQLLSGSEVQESAVSDLGLKMGENVVLKDSGVLDSGVIGSYVHSNNKIGAVVVLDGGDSEIAKQIAMHVTATKPKALNPEDVDAAYIEKELAFAKEELEKSGKPEAIFDKILSGKESKLRADAALTAQSFVMNPDQTVSEFAKAHGATVTMFKLLSL